MTHPKGWINRQIAALEKASKRWPAWMRRESGKRVKKAKEAK